MSYSSPKPRFLSGGRIRRNGIFWLPNAITTLALFSGFYAIVQAMNTRFDLAAEGILAAMVFDGLDGRVARLTRTQSAFGAEYDSLSDMVSFGAAPALVIYEWALKGMGKLGWVAAFLYCGCAALRLARFNTTLATMDKRFFQGLPSPAAAGLLAAFVWTVESFHMDPSLLRWVASALAVFAGLTMVSNIRFYSGKGINFRRSVPFFVVVLIVLSIIALIEVASSLPQLLFAGFVVYALSGYVGSLLGRLRPRPPAPLPAPSLPPDGL